MNDEVTFRPHWSLGLAAWALGLLALAGGVYLGVTETRGAGYVVGISAICGALALFPLWFHRTWLRITDNDVVQMNMWTRVVPLSTIRAVRVDPNMRYLPAVLKLTNGKQLILAATTQSYEAAGEVMKRLRFTVHVHSDERPLTDWERNVVDRLSDYAEPTEPVRESLPFLVVTGTCECGCASFHVRDFRFPAQAHALFQYATGTTSRGVSATLWVGADRRPSSIGIDNEPGLLPDPVALRVVRRSQDPRLDKGTKA